MPEIKKPENWHNQQGWDNYYASLIQDGSYLEESKHTGSISFDRLPQFVEELKSNDLKNVWVSGCGVSLMPKLLAKGGLNVHATDISPAAVAFQQNDNDPKVNALIEKSEVQADNSRFFDCRSSRFYKALFGKSFRLYYQRQSHSRF